MTPLKMVRIFILFDGQHTGIGHFSTVEGYHAEMDMAFVLDVASLKYNPHWVPLNLLRGNNVQH
ncbi:hypothetical protein Fmac_030614 [Flemingia macrophylla]|uniref:glutathione gamma-glutamylcysteinyltransferase n=1 Tax=Flemingia macrophylla TaxID=520843 RepID=A0ABD1KZP0_9FABA